MAKRKKKTEEKKQLSVWLLAGAAFVILALIVGTSLLPPAQPAVGQAALENGGLPKEVTVAQAAELRNAGAFVLDVREPSEWQEVHVPDSTLIPLGTLSDRLSEVPKDREVVVICRSGNRSAQARDVLLAAGFENVTSVAGGVIQWKAKGYPTVSGP